MTSHDFFCPRSSAHINQYSYCSRLIGRSLPVAIGKAIALLLVSIACGVSAEAAIKNDGGFGRSPSGGWIKVAETESITTYMYPSTVHGQGKLAHMWSLINYKSPQTNSVSSLSFMSEKSEDEYDCEKAMWRTLSSALHTHAMGNGQTVFSKSEPGQWRPVTANFDSEMLWKVACKKVRSKRNGR